MRRSAKGCARRFSRRSLRRSFQPPTMKERSSNLNNNLSVEELFLALSGRQSGRNTAAVQQIAHEPVVLGPVVAAARHVMGAQRAVPRDSDTARCAKAHRSTA